MPDGTTDAKTDAPTPPGALPTLAVGSWADHTCAIFETGEAKCWGYNGDGELGLGDVDNRGDGPGEMGTALPVVAVGPGRTVRRIALSGAATCAVLDDQSLKCWGNNAYGQLGLGDGLPRGVAANQMGASLPAVDLGAGRKAASVVGGSLHTCALLDDGSVKCWGFNTNGQLGRGDKVTRGDLAGQMGASLPAIDLGVGRSAMALASGASFVCALLDNGSVKCWGNNEAFQLGVSDAIDRGDDPGEMGDALPVVNLGPGRTATSVAAGGASACAILDDGQTKCWGKKIGAQGVHGGELAGVDFGVGRTAKQLSIGADRACAVLDDESVKCWGQNDVGQLGQGHMFVRAVPTAVDLGTNKRARSVSAYGRYTCAVLTDGTVKCWGSGRLGHLGSGNEQDRGDAPGEMGDALPAVSLR